LLDRTLTNTQTDFINSDCKNVLEFAGQALGGIAPGDSVATGTFYPESGDARSGSFRVLTRGTRQTREEFATGGVAHITVFSEGSVWLDNSPVEGSAELAATSQSAIWLLPLITDALKDNSLAVHCLGRDDVEGQRLFHLRLDRDGEMANGYLRPFTSLDFWLDPITYLPRKMSFVRRDGGGAVPGVPVELTYGEYNDILGYKYPFLVRFFINGNPWGTVRIASVGFNTGVSDLNFKIAGGE
jgi:hypothetical protein